MTGTEKATPAVVCPHCGYRDEEWADELLSRGESGHWYSVEPCTTCDKPMRVNWSLDFTIETEMPTPEEIAAHNEKSV